MNRFQFLVFFWVTTMAIAYPPEFDYTPVRLPDNPIITPQMFTNAGVPNDGHNINGPSLIRIPSWIPVNERAHPSAEYYLYFADHGGSYIRMAWAANVEGPYTLYNPGSGVLAVSSTNNITDTQRKKHRGIILGTKIAVGGHIASPDVVVDDVNQRIIMFYHGFHFGKSDPAQAQWEKNDQRGFAATAPYGLNFVSEPGQRGGYYARWLEWNGTNYISRFHVMAMGGTNILDSYSGNGGNSRIFNPQTGYEGTVRHTAVKVKGDKLGVWFSGKNQTPERIIFTVVQMKPDITKWTALDEGATFLQPEYDWEGADLPIETSASGGTGRTHALRDPGYFQDPVTGKEYLLYCVAGESGIAIAELVLNGASQNLVANGGAEDGTAGWTKIGNVSATTTQAHVYEGTKAFRIVGNPTGNPKAKQTIAVSGNTQYAIRGFVKTEFTSGKAFIKFKIYNASGGTISTTRLDEFTGFNEYTVQTKTFTTPAGAKTVGIELETDDASGIAYFDSIVLMETVPNLLTNPGAEYGIADWTKVGNGTTSTAPGNVYAGSAAFKVNGGSGDRYLWQSVPVIENTTYSLSGFMKTRLSAGKAYIRYEVRNAGGVSILAKRVEEIYGTNAYVFTDDTFTTPSGAETVRVELVAKYATGEAYFDVISLVPGAVPASSGDVSFVSGSSPRAVSVPSTFGANTVVTHNQEITFTFPSETLGATLTIYDIDGRLLESKVDIRTTSYTLDTRSSYGLQSENGVYVYTIRLNNGATKSGVFIIAE